jgi:hypothetical protein
VGSKDGESLLFFEKSPWSLRESLVLGKEFQMLEKEFQIFGKESMIFFKGSMMYERVFRSYGFA